MLFRQPQRHCKNAVKKQVLVNAFGLTKTCFVLVLLGSPKTCLQITNKKFDANSHRRSETKIAKRSLTSTKPTYNGKKEVLVPIYRK